MAITVEDVEVRKEDACFKFKPDESTRTLSPDSEGRNLIPRKYPINIGFRFIECGSLGFQSNIDVFILYHNRFPVPNGAYIYSLQCIITDSSQLHLVSRASLRYFRVLYPALPACKLVTSTASRPGQNLKVLAQYRCNHTLLRPTPLPWAPLRQPWSRWRASSGRRTSRSISVPRVGPI